VSGLLILKEIMDVLSMHKARHQDSWFNIFK